MIEKDKLIKVTNRDSGTVGYDVDDLTIPHRHFWPGETKEVTFEELEKLASNPAGERMLRHHLIVKDYEAVKELLGNVEPEYYYDEDKIKNIMIRGSLDAFKDMIDFAPDGVLEEIEDLAVSLPLNDIAKRSYIKDKLGFNVDSAERVAKTKFDGDPDSNFAKPETKERRVPVESHDEAAAAPKRRVVTIKKD